MQKKYSTYFLLPEQYDINLTDKIQNNSGYDRPD